MARNRFVTAFKRLLTLGPQKEREYFIENLSTLVASGMPILDAVDAVAEEIHSTALLRLIANIRADVEAGVAFSLALEKTGLFAPHAVSLIRIGETSGKLTENLRIVAAEQENARELSAKLRSAMLYPMFVLTLTLVIGTAIAWFILPKLATVFAQLHLKLPLITRILIAAGFFLSKHGLIAVPLFFVAIVLMFSILFVIPKTKRIGQFILLRTPGIGRLLREVELARLGYLLGTLLTAGVPIIDSIDSLADAAALAPYKRFYRYLSTSIQDGNTFKQSFGQYRNSRALIPAPIQQLVISAEHSGTLASTFIKIGQQYNARTENTTKDLTVILEPLLLVIVWLGVVAVAIAVILPIYSLEGSLSEAASPSTPAAHHP